jgi:hypothetical protein
MIINPTMKVPYLLAVLVESSFESSICANPYETWGQGPTGFAVMVFAFSKIPELIDTVFIVLRKQSLILLHWYHHITVLLFCWRFVAKDHLKLISKLTLHKTFLVRTPLSQALDSTLWP